MFPLRKTLASITGARIIPLMAACAALSVLVILLAAGGVAWLTAALVHFKAGWLEALLSGSAGLLAGVGGWFMLPALMLLISGMFTEKVIHRVERAYYPDAARQEEPRFWPDLFHDVRFTLAAVGLNILILPFYFIGLGFAMAVALNSYLLGREFFESAAGYYMGKPRARELSKGKKAARARYLGGAVITLMALVPLMNLFVPIFAIVWMTHVVHDPGLDLLPVKPETPEIAHE